MYSQYVWSIFYTVSCWTSVSNYQLSPHRDGPRIEPPRWKGGVTPNYMRRIIIVCFCGSHVANLKQS